MDSQVDTSQCKFLTCMQLVFRLATHLHGLVLTLVKLKFICKSTQVDHKAFVYMHKIYDMYELVSWLANLFGLPSQSVCKFWFWKLVWTCINFQVHLARGRGYAHVHFCASLLCISVIYYYWLLCYHLYELWTHENTQSWITRKLVQ